MSFNYSVYLFVCQALVPRSDYGPTHPSSMPFIDRMNTPLNSGFLTPFYFHQSPFHCYLLVGIYFYIIFPLIVMTLISGVGVLGITFSGKIKQNYKYFVVNVIFWYLLDGIRSIMTIFLIFPKSIYHKTVADIFNQYILLLSFTTSFSLALHRYLSLAFSSRYQSLENNTKLILFIIFFYDSAIILYIVGTRPLNTRYFYIFGYLTRVGYQHLIIPATALATIAVSVLLFFQIRKQASQISTSEMFRQTLKDAKRAAFYCLLTGTNSFLISILSPVLGYFGYQEIDINFYLVVKNKLYGRYVAWLTAIDIVYQVLVVIDFLAILFILKAYRNVGKVIFKKWFSRMFKNSNAVIPVATSPKSSFALTATKRP